MKQDAKMLPTEAFENKTEQDVIKIKAIQSARLTSSGEPSGLEVAAYIKKGMVANIIDTDKYGNGYYLVEFRSKVRKYKGPHGIPTGPVVGHDGLGMCNKRTAVGHGWCFRKKVLDNYFEVC